jgi:NAD(P)-dependent dehydrogenase (short-subunit alcohol dehydrogenase family)
VLAGKAAIVTGGGSGIGEEVSVQFSEHGASVAVADINPESGECVTRRILESGGQATFLHVDVRECNQVQQAVSRAIEAFGTVDILVNCAGLNTFKDVQEVSYELWDRIRSINLDGAFNFCRAVIGTMIQQRSGKIINIGSAAAIKAIPKALPYVAAKHGLVGLTRALAVDLGPHNINVNCICPGPIQTPLLERETNPAFREGITKAIPLDRLGKPSDIAAAALFLASPQSDWITGVILPVDGGLVSCVRAHHYE